VPTVAPPLDPRLGALLARVWPALPGAVGRAEALGASWTAVSTPFVAWEDGRAVGHVGVIELPLVVGGRPCRVGSIHAVCTDPDRRGRGLGGRLVREALAACRDRYETVVLTTLIPQFYVPFGFRPVREHAFSRALPAVTPGPGGRPLTAAPADAALLRRLLGRRAPVSERLGSLEDGDVFLVALMLTWGDLSRVRYHADLDAVTVHEVRDGTLVLYDVVAATIPALPALAAAVGGGAERVVTFFAPDRLGDGFAAEPWDVARTEALGGDWFAGLMARGPFAVEADAFMLPPLSRT
jgi:GNAT superfamily N-acetyltransferase